MVVRFFSSFPRGRHILNGYSFWKLRSVNRSLKLPALQLLGRSSCHLLISEVSYLLPLGKFIFFHLFQGKCIICTSFFKCGNLWEGQSADDFKYDDCKGSSGPVGVSWIKAEILLLLEFVLNHGGDWELVAQIFMTKSKLDCIVKLIELPFGEFILGRTNGLQRSSVDNNASTTYHMSRSANMLNASVPERQSSENTGGTEQNANTNEDVVQGPPPKKLRAGSLDNISSLMKQVLWVALISSMAAPTLAAFAGDSAVSAICQETLCSREIFDAQEEYLKKGTSKNVSQIVDAEVDNAATSASHDQASIPEVNFMPLKARVATATALVAAAAHAKLLVEQEERELDHFRLHIIEI